MPLLRRRFQLMGIAVLFGLIAGIPLEAQLTPAFDFTGRGNWSLDGAFEGDSVDVLVAPDSQVLQAYLYCSVALGTAAPANVTPTVELQGTVYGPSSFATLPFVQFSTVDTGMQGFRADATDQILAGVGEGSPTPFSFSIDSVTLPPVLGSLTGVALVVVYENEAELHRRIVIYDGGAATAGDSFSIQLDEPIDPELDGFQALLSLGIGFSTAGQQQRTLLDVEGRRLTSIAGGDNDNGGSLTVGGQGDDPANPLDPLSTSVNDDELYDLNQGNAIDPTPYVLGGETSLTFDTENIGQDDHLFLAGLNIVTPEREIAEVPALGAVGQSLLVAFLVLAGLVVLRKARSMRRVLD